MSEERFIEILEQRGLIIISKDVLEQKLIEVRKQTMVDKRVKWITAKEAILKYDVTYHWLQKNEKDTSSELKVIKGPGRTSTKKYNEQSIIDQQQREAC